MVHLKTGTSTYVDFVNITTKFSFMYLTLRTAPSARPLFSPSLTFMCLDIPARKLKDHVAKLFVIFYDQALCNIQREVIQGIVLGRLCYTWSVQPQKNTVYNTDFQYKIHKILPVFLWKSSNRILWSVLLEAVQSIVVLLVMMYWRRTLKNDEVTTPPVSDGGFITEWVWCNDEINLFSSKLGISISFENIF